eukprot:5574608-Ditylum_brightwellii.AAC.1
MASVCRNYLAGLKWNPLGALTKRLLIGFPSRTKWKAKIAKKSLQDKRTPIVQEVHTHFVGMTLVYTM